VHRRRGDRCIAPTFEGLEERLALVPSYREVVPFFTAALDEARRLSVPAKIPGRCGVPLCLLGAHRRFATNYMERTAVEVPDTHLKPSTCMACPLGRWCEGLWRGYVEIYGVGEVVVARGEV